MRYPPSAQDRQPRGPTPLLRELQQYCPGYFSGSEFGMFGHRRAPLEGSIGVRVTHGIAGYAGNGSTNCAVVPWQGVNLNTRPELTWVLVYKKNATGVQLTAIAGFGATSGSPGNTLFRIIGGSSANSIRLQVQDSSGTIYFNTDSSDFGANDLQYHCVVVSGWIGPLGQGGGLQYYADGRKLNFSQSESGSNPTSTLFNIATLLCARRGGALSGADGNYDVALFVPLFGIRQPDRWCQEISRNPWQLFEAERRIWMPAFEAPIGGNVTVSISGVSATATLGALSSAVQIALTGTSAATALGSVSPDRAIPLTGNSATVSVGSVAAALSAALSGNAITTALGTITASAGGNVTVALTGVSATVAAGVIVPALALSVSGNAASAIVGNIGVARSVNLTSVTASAALGTITATGGTVVTPKRNFRRTRYTPGTPPADLEGLRRFLREELERLTDSLESPATHLLLEKLSQEPSRQLTDKAYVAYADGTSWDPGSGEGVYAYYDGSWKKLG